MSALSLRARWIFPVSGEPIEDGSIEIEGERIVAVNEQASLGALDLGNVALIPGLVNAHTHLEFSDLTQPLQPATPFSAWIRKLVSHRRSRTADPTENIGKGLCESATSGTTCLGEIATSGWSGYSASDNDPCSVVFHESLGLSEENIDEQLRLARVHLESPRNDESFRVVHGLSPHAPYSVHPRLFKPLIDLAAEFNAPVAVHLAETQAERQLLSDGTGELVEMLEQFGVWNPDAIPAKSRPLDYLKELAKLDRALAIHGNYFDDEEIDFLSQHNNISVVYCPRTHAFFGHTDHPWRTMIDRGVAVAIGTDSRASNPDLSLWNELLFLRERHPQVPPGDLLQLGTQAGAQALGLDHRSGSIAVGFMADIAAVSLNSELTADPYEQLFASNNEVVSTMIAGKWIDV